MMPKTSSVIVPKDSPKPKFTEAEQAELRAALMSCPGQKTWWSTAMTLASPGAFASFWKDSGAPERI